MSEEEGDEEGVVSEALSLLSLDTHNREVTSAHGTYIHRKPQVNCAKKAAGM